MFEADERGRPDHEAAVTRSHEPTLSLMAQPQLARRGRAYAILVLMPQGRHRRRVYLSLHAAERALGRAEAEGKAAALVLCHLTLVRSVAANDDWPGDDDGWPADDQAVAS